MSYVYKVPNLFSYDEALAHYELTKPFNRGRYKGLRPLVNTKGGRRHNELLLKKRVGDARGEVLTVTYCSRVLVEYFPDRRNKVFVRNHGGYSRSTALTASNVLTNLLGRNKSSAYFSAYGSSLCFQDVSHEPKGWINLPKNGAEFELKEWKGQYDCDREVILLTDAPQYGYYIRRKVMNQKRTKWGAFIKYAKASAKMVDPEQYNRWHITRDHVDVGWGKGTAPPHLTAKQFYEMMCDEEQWGKAIHWLMFTCSYHIGRQTHIELKDVITKIDTVLKYMYADELFEQRKVSSINTNGNNHFVDNKGGGTWI
jgi:hypothetical protein